MPRNQPKPGAPPHTIRCSATTARDTATLARRAAESYLGGSVRPPTRLAAGQSCAAFAVEGAESGAGPWVVRVPRPGTDRSIRFHAEATVGALLAAKGHPVAAWKVVEVEGTACAIGERLAGTAINPKAAWTPVFSAQLGDLLADLHQLPTVGFGPLVDDEGKLRAQSASARDGVRERWSSASCWPFDGSDLADHPISRSLPEIARAIAPLRDELLAAAEGPMGLVHSDLHHEHLLAGSDGSLTGVLDFGDAFIGSVAWDFALLHWYYGPAVSQAVARRHPLGPEVDGQSRLLATAVGIHKLAKSPTDPQVPLRLSELLAAP